MLNHELPTLSPVSIEESEKQIGMYTNLLVYAKSLFNEIQSLTQLIQALTFKSFHLNIIYLYLLCMNQVHSIHI